MKRFFVVGVGLSACCVLTPQANAGEWVASYEVVSGSSSGQYAWSVGPAQAPIFNQPYARNWVDGFWTIPRDGFKTAHPHFANSVSPTEYGVASSSSSYTVSKGGVGQAEIAGDVKVIWTWTASQGETTPGPVPAEIKYSVQSQTNSSASNAHQSNESPTRVTTGEAGEADAGLPGAQQTSGIDSSASWWQSQGKKLYIQKTNGQSVIEGPTIHVTAKASIPAERKKINPPSGPYPPPEIERTFYLFGAVSAAASVVSNLDDRSVSISRPGAINEWLDADGVTMHGDSRFSWDRVATHYVVPDPVTQSFTASLSGIEWTLRQKINSTTNIPYGPSFPDVTYEWSLGTSSPTGQSQDVDANDPYRIQQTMTMPYGNPQLDVLPFPNEWIGDPTPSQTITVSYTARDNGDQASGTAKYILHLHDEVEFVGNEMIFNAGQEYAYVRRPDNSIQKIIGSNFVNESQHGLEQSTSSGYSYQWGFSAGLPLDKIIKWLKIKKGFTPDVSATFEKNWGNDYTVVTPLGRDIPTGQKAFPVSITFYEWHQWYYRQFLPEGEIKPTIPPGLGPHYGVGQGISPDALYWESAIKKKTDADSVVWIWVDNNFSDPGSTDTPPREIVEDSYFNS